MSENTLENIIFGLKTELEELKAENAGLKERGEKIINELHKTIDAQKAEIERLTEENGQLKSYNSGLEYENTELQQQINELKAENTELYKEHTALIAGSILAKQNIAKDTAKEILTELDLFFNGTTFRKGYEFKKINEKLKEIAKRNGVEVE
jgi:predicted RNase H-like nuclease (RuvC/YqgF family)